MLNDHTEIDKKVWRLILNHGKVQALLTLFQELKKVENLLSQDHEAQDSLLCARRIAYAFLEMEEISQKITGQAKSMLKRLRPLEDWLENDEAVEAVKRVFGDPVKFYEKFKNNIISLTK